MRLGTGLLLVLAIACSDTRNIAEPRGSDRSQPNVAASGDLSITASDSIAAMEAANHWYSRNPLRGAPVSYEQFLNDQACLSDDQLEAIATQNGLLQMEPRFPGDSVAMDRWTGRPVPIATSSGEAGAFTGFCDDMYRLCAMGCGFRRTAYLRNFCYRACMAAYAECKARRGGGGGPGRPRPKPTQTPSSTS